MVVTPKGIVLKDPSAPRVKASLQNRYRNLIDHIDADLFPTDYVEAVMAAYEQIKPAHPTSPSSTQCQNVHSKTGSRPPSSRNSTMEPTKNAINNINPYPFALSAFFALFHQFPHPKVQRMQSGKDYIEKDHKITYICN